MNATQWNEQPYFAALDWARAHHDVVIIDRLGQIKVALRFEHTAEGWASLRTLLVQYPKLGSGSVCVGWALCPTPKPSTSLCRE
jgi:hypothetical protein